MAPTIEPPPEADAASAGGATSVAAAAPVADAVPVAAATPVAGAAFFTGAASLEEVLSEVAGIVTETLDLEDVFDRAAACVRRLVPFDDMNVVRIVDGERVALYATTRPEGRAEECSEKPLAEWSPRWRPRPGPGRRIDDARAELDPAFPMDAHVLESDVGSAMWEPFRRGDSFVGGMWVCAAAPHAFSDGHQTVLRLVAALLGSAGERWGRWHAERRRRERLELVEGLLATLPDSLDVQAILERLSAGVQSILAHDFMNLTELDVEARTIRTSAWVGESDAPVHTEPIPLTDDEMDRRVHVFADGRNVVDFEILCDIRSELAPDTERQRLIRQTGFRSWLRVPVLLSGEVRGGLSLLHREPGRYDWEDVEVAIRLADRVALVLSRQRLAEEARIAAEARERAERLEATVDTLVRELEARRQGRIVGVSSSWKETLRQVGRVAPSETTVLVTGESGTGKEVISRLLHDGSRRAARPMVAINCAALPEHLLESELFGHERGAFTGAVRTKIGRIEQVAGGTLLLDEVAEMSPLLQAKLLRVLEEREFQRVGGTRTLEADVRVIAATHRDRSARIAQGEFREDLYYRLAVFQIHVRPLRDRPEDILPLAEAFLEDLGRRMGRPAAGISRDARDWLLAYRWPGNVRELRAGMRRIPRLSLPRASTSPRWSAGSSRGRWTTPAATSRRPRVSSV